MSKRILKLLNPDGLEIPIVFEKGEERMEAALIATKNISISALEAGVVADLLAAAKAALEYDRLIQLQAKRLADEGHTGSEKSVAVFDEEGLDVAYNKWITLASKAISKAEGEGDHFEGKPIFGKGMSPGINDHPNDVHESKWVDSQGKEIKKKP